MYDENGNYYNDPCITIISELSSGIEFSFGSTYIGSFSGQNQNSEEISSIVVLKLYKQPEMVYRIAHSIHELTIGMCVTNVLAKKCPTFIRTEGVTLTNFLQVNKKCREEVRLGIELLIQSRKLENRLRDIRETNSNDSDSGSDIMSHKYNKLVCDISVPVLVLEPIIPSISLKNWFLSDQFNIIQFAHFYFHIICAIMIGFEEFHFIHQDLSLSNILLQSKFKGILDCQYAQFDINERKEIYNLCISYPSKLSSNVYRLPVRKLLPRIIDYGLSSAEINQMYWNYLDVIHPSAETCHFLNDISKLIGFPIWCQNNDLDDKQLHDKTHYGFYSIQISCRSALSHSMAIHTHQFLTQKVLFSSHPKTDEFIFYIDALFVPWIYRLVYPNVEILSPINDKYELKFQTYSFIHPIWKSVLHSLALFEHCIHQCKYWEHRKEFQGNSNRKSPSDNSHDSFEKIAPYIPREFNTLQLVNYFYLPNFQIYIDLEEIFTKAQMDIYALNELPSLKIWVLFVQKTKLFDSLRNFFNVKFNFQYATRVKEYIEILHELLPHVQIYIEQVLLSKNFTVLGVGRNIFFSKSAGRRLNEKMKIENKPS